MADVAGLLKTEIVRLSKKTIRQALAPLQRSSTAHRREMAALKRQIAGLERSIASLQKDRAKQDRAAPPDQSPTPHRFVAKGLRTLRSRLGLSQEDFGRLVGVSAQSVYNWERQTSRPRPAQLAAIASVRSMGKREARQKLEELSAG